MRADQPQVQGSNLSADVHLTHGQIRHLLEMIAMCDQLEWGRNRRVVLRAKLQAALDAQPGCEECENVARLNENPPIGGRYYCRRHGDR